MINQTRLFIASCLSLIATSMAFSIRADIIPALKADFGFTDTQMGQIVGPGLWGFAITIVIGGMLVDRFGMKRLMFVAFFGHLLGATLTIFAQGYVSLYIATLLIGLANGTVEAVINPLVASISRDRKAHFLNILHAWWPGGLIIGGLSCYALTKWMGLDSSSIPLATASLGWKIKMALIYVPALVYGYLCLGQEFPKTERAASNVTTSEMYREALKPLFMVFLFLMIFTTATELGPDQWIGNLLSNLVGIQGILLLVYTAGIMFILRQFCSGFLLNRLSPLGLLATSSVIAAIGLYAISSSKTALGVLAAATIFGLGKSFFWPTMVGVVSEQFPKGGALVMGLIGGMGMFSAGWLAAPAIGAIQDHYALASLSQETRTLVVSDGGLDEKKVLSVESPTVKTEIETAKKYSAEMTYKWMSLIPAILSIIFLGLYFYFRSKGGYRVQHIGAETPKISKAS
jgi:MFS family permease